MEDPCRQTALINKSFSGSQQLCVSMSVRDGVVKGMATEHWKCGWGGGRKRGGIIQWAPSQFGKVSISGSGW